MKKLLICLLLVGCAQQPIQGFLPSDARSECVNGERWVVNDAGAYNTREVCDRGEM